MESEPDPPLSRRISRPVKRPSCAAASLIKGTDCARWRAGWQFDLDDVGAELRKKVAGQEAALICQIDNAVWAEQAITRSHYFMRQSYCLPISHLPQFYYCMMQNFAPDFETYA
jgi:hypothetical protein